MGNLNLGAGQLKADQWVNNDGTENYKCRAWVNFNGIGTVAIRASGNVTSITDNGTGDYTVNFTNALADANYSTVATTSAAGPATYLAELNENTVPSTTAVRILTGYAGAGNDRNYNNVAIFR